MITKISGGASEICGVGHIVSELQTPICPSVKCNISNNARVTIIFILYLRYLATRLSVRLMGILHMLFNQWGFLW